MNRYFDWLDEQLPTFSRMSEFDGIKDFTEACRRLLSPTDADDAPFPVRPSERQNIMNFWKYHHAENSAITENDPRWVAVDPTWPEDLLKLIDAVYSANSEEEINSWYYKAVKACKTSQQHLCLNQRRIKRLEEIDLQLAIGSKSWDKLEDQNMVRVDHLGNKFPSEEALLQHYHLCGGTLYRRLRLGIPLGEALTTPLRSHPIEIAAKKERLKKTQLRKKQAKEMEERNSWIVPVIDETWPEKFKNAFCAVRDARSLDELMQRYHDAFLLVQNEKQHEELNRMMIYWKHYHDRLAVQDEKKNWNKNNLKGI